MKTQKIKQLEKKRNDSPYRPDIDYYLTVFNGTQQLLSARDLKCNAFLTVNVKGSIFRSVVKACASHRPNSKIIH